MITKGTSLHRCNDVLKWPDCTLSFVWLIIDMVRCLTVRQNRFVTQSIAKAAELADPAQHTLTDAAADGLIQPNFAVRYEL